ncbi:MAG: hypothetical protein IPL28_08075 [Chloroflexi bacterium]|nr:hypothetical protein [Chloroflexota bacterium]
MWHKFRQWWHGRTSPSPAEAAVLHAIGRGSTLKSHRDVDGHKVYRLHPLQGEAADVPYAVVQTLLHQNYLTTNQKFPAATFLLTSKGKAWLTTQGDTLHGLSDIG